MMKILDVINVGQGDCFILHTESGCLYSEFDLIIDLGTSKTDISKFIGNKAKIMITHGHNDHLSGLQYLTGSDFSKVDELILPLHFNEILVITKMIMNIKNFKNSKYCKDLYNELESVIRESYILGKSKCDFILSFVYEGLNLCNHIEILNPPKPIEDEVDLYNEIKDNDFVLLKDLFHEESVKFIKDLLMIIHEEMIFNNNQLSDYPKINEDFNLYKNVLTTEGIRVFSGKNRVNYILGFFIENKVELKRFINKPTKRNFISIYNHYQKKGNDTSIVMSYKSSGKKFLFTGDAGKDVYNRIINNGFDLSCDYLKVPHHGSKHSLNRTILKNMNPRYAIIPHENGKFGKSKDSHPNIEIVDLLNQMKCEIFFTNDVIKNGTIKYKKQTGLTKDRLVDFK